MHPSLPLLRLPMPHYTSADAWACLPSPVREAGRDYLRAERVTHRFVHPDDGMLLARIDGWQADRAPRAWPDCDGMRIACSCGRRQPCPHIAALLMAFAEAPATFLPLVLRPQSQDFWDAVLGWASGTAFPWAAIEARMRQNRTEGPKDVLSRAPAGQALSALRVWIETAPAERIQDAVRGAWREVLARAATPPVSPAEAGGFLDLLARHPDLDLEALLPAVRPANAVEPLLLAALYRTEADFTDRARPSVLLRARTLALLYADWLYAQGRTSSVRRSLQPFSVLKPAGLRLGDWLFTHGQPGEARRLWEETRPRNAAEERQRAERLKLLTRSGAPADPGPE